MVRAKYWGVPGAVSREGDMVWKVHWTLKQKNSRIGQPDDA